jgi:hypothetical protein
VQVFAASAVFLYVLHSELKTSRAFYRRLNERLLEEHVTHRGETELAAFFCECGDAHCSRWVRLSAGVLEQWLVEPSCALVAPGHESEEDEVVFRTDRYVVVSDGL